MAKAVLLLLLLASIYCWAIIFAKWRLLKGALAQNQSFLDVFWHGKSLEDIFARCEEYRTSPVANVFKSGFKELKKLPPSDAAAIRDDAVANVARALNRAATQEINRAEKNVGWLATTASERPVGWDR